MHGDDERTTASATRYTSIFFSVDYNHGGTAMQCDQLRTFAAGLAHQLAESSLRILQQPGAWWRFRGRRSVCYGSFLHSSQTD
jgi:hypothetical protein